eukprot:14191954-Alexandrium_andersonii.AAC.1
MIPGRLGAQGLSPLAPPGALFPNSEPLRGGDTSACHGQPDGDQVLVASSWVRPGTSVVPDR